MYEAFLKYAQNATQFDKVVPLTMFIFPVGKCIVNSIAHLHEGKEGTLTIGFIFFFGEDSTEVYDALYSLDDAQLT